MFNKRYIGLLTLIFTVLQSSLFAQEVILTLENAQQCGTGQILVPVRISQINPVFSMTLRIVFNTNHLAYNGIQNLNSKISSGSNIANPPAFPDQIRFAWSSTSPVSFTNNELLFNIRFNPILGISNIVWDPNENEVTNSTTPYSLGFVNGLIQTLTTPAAAGPITGSAQICSGTNHVAFSVDSVAYATSYLWNYSGSGATIHGNGRNVTISFASNATSGNLTVRGTNFCGNGPVSPTFAVTILQVPEQAGNIYGSSTVCQSQTGVAYSVPVVAGATSYQWNYSGTGATIYNGTSNSITISFSNSATSGILRVIGVNQCGNGLPSPEFSIQVNPLPGSPGSISGTSSVCPGTSNVVYSVPQIPEASSYMWSYSGTGITINNGSTNQILVDFSNNASSGQLTVRGVNSCGNGPVSAAFQINIEPLPANPGTITGSSTVCQGQQSVSYTVPNILYATSYNWSYTGSGVSINGSGTTVELNFSNNATSGNLRVRGENACGSGPFSADFAITVQPLPGQAGSISGSSVVCQGQNNVEYSVPAIAGATGYSWNYSGSGATISNGASNSITISFSSTAISGNLTVRGVNACGNGPLSVAFPITVNPLPGSPGSISGATSVCPGSTGVVYTVSSVPNATSYQWSYTGTGITINNHTSNTIYIDFSGSATSGILTVRGVNDCGEGPVSQNFSITINPLPSNAGNISGAGVVCQSQSNVSYTVAPILHATSYSWSYTGSGATITNGTTNSIQINFSSSATGGVLSVRGINACGMGPVSAGFEIVVNPLPAQPGPISGPSIVCQNQNNVPFSIAPVQNASVYTWNYSGSGATISNGSSNSITIIFSPTATSGNLTVRGVNACGNGPLSVAFPITVNPLPAAPGTISGPSVVCQGQTGVPYSVPAINHATSYFWSYSGTGATILNQGSNQVNINFASTATAGILTVRGVNSCGEGPVSNGYNIFMNLLPGEAGNISGVSNVCQGQSGVNFSVPVIAGATAYQWTYTGSGITINFANTNNITASFSSTATSGNLIVSGTNSCGSGPQSAPFPIIVNTLPASPGTITGPATVCKGATGITYSVEPVAGATSYLWSYSGSGATILNGSTNIITVNFASNATSGNFTVRGINACGNGPISPNYLVTLQSLPGTPGSISGTPTVCQGNSSISYTVPVIANATSYYWEYSGSGITINNSTSNSITIDFSVHATSGLLKVRGINACGSGPFSSNYSITVNPLPGTPGPISGSPIVCQGQSGVAYSVPSIPNVFGYMWSYSGTGATINNGSTNNVTIAFSSSATSGDLTVRGINSCGSGPWSASYPIVVNPLPSAPGSIMGNATVCQGQFGVEYTIPEILNATGYSWTYTGSGVTINNSNSNTILIDFASNATSGNLRVRGTNACGNGPLSANFGITVNPLPKAASTILGPTEICLGQSGVFYSVPTIMHATSYEWTYTGAGVTINNNGANNVLLDFSINATSGNLLVRGVNSCGFGSYSPALSINMITVPGAAGTISGVQQVVAGTQEVPYEIIPVQGAVSYQWVYSGSGVTIQGSGNSVTLSFDLNATSGTLTVIPVNGCGSGQVSPGLYINVTSGIKMLNLQCLLEGPFTGSQMNTGLLSNNYLPNSQPYTSAPWLYSGNETVTSFPADVVDWLLIELRDAPVAANATQGTIIWRKAVFLRNDGQVLDLDGSTTIPLPGLSYNHQLFVVIRHRNHLDIMSSIGLTEENGTFSWDFTTAQSKAYGNGQKPLSGNKFGMYGGDGDGNGQVQNQDKNAVWNPQSGQSGYIQGDYDLNGQVQNQDKNNIWNPNSGKGSSVP